MIVTITRPARESDKNFILNSWLRSYRKNVTWYCRARLSSTEYFEGHRSIVYGALETSDVSVLCDPEDDDQIYGWCCHRRLNSDSVIVHFLYVKAPYRGFGLGEYLFDYVLDGSGCIATHWTWRLVDDKADSKRRIDVNPYYGWAA